MQHTVRIFGPNFAFGLIYLVLRDPQSSTSSQCPTSSNHKFTSPDMIIIQVIYVIFIWYLYDIYMIFIWSVFYMCYTYPSARPALSASTLMAASSSSAFNWRSTWNICGTWFKMPRNFLTSNWRSMENLCAGKLKINGKFNVLGKIEDLWSVWTWYIIRHCF